VAEHVGFAMEGTLRAFMPSKDGPRDYLMYGLTRADWTRAGA
jgi:RimJ/RimL family protein N-acetyltransferase